MTAAGEGGAAGCSGSGVPSGGTVFPLKCPRAESPRNGHVQTGTYFLGAHVRADSCTEVFKTGPVTSFGQKSIRSFVISAWARGAGPAAGEERLFQEAEDKAFGCLCQFT